VTAISRTFCVGGDVPSAVYKRCTAWAVFLVEVGDLLDNLCELFAGRGPA
jgi:hypothetical protein